MEREAIAETASAAAEEEGKDGEKGGAAGGAGGDGFGEDDSGSGGRRKFARFEADGESYVVDFGCV